MYFHEQLILHDLHIPLPHEDGFRRLKMVMLKVDITVFVMTMASMQTKHGCREIGFMRLIMIFLVMIFFDGGGWVD